MKRNKLCKKLLSAGLVLACVMQLAGCSSKGGEDKENAQGGNSGGNSDGYVYVAEYQSVDAVGFSTSVLSGDTLYYLTGNYDEEKEEYKQNVAKIKIGDAASEVLPIEIEPNSYVNSLLVDTDGNLLTVMSRSEEEGDNWKSFYELKRYSPDGEELFSKDITSLGDGMENFYLQYLVQDSQGNIYLFGSENYIWILDKEGNKTGQLNTDNWINAMFALPNGNAAVSYWGNDGIVLSEIDPATKQLGKTYKNLPNAYNNFVSGGENTVLMTGDGRVYAYDITTETYEEVVNWINCDVDGDYIRSVSMLEDGRIFAVSVDWSAETSTTEFIYLTKKPASEVAQKEYITLGTIYLDQNVKRNIIKFNKTNEKYRIEVKEYGTDDWEAGRTQLNNEIVSGAGPDIIDLSNANAELYIEKGILEDLNPYVDTDADIKREDYVEKAFNAYERSGKLYGIVPSFGVSTVLGKVSDVGSEPGWTIDDVMALMESKPEGTELFSYGTKEQALYYCCTTSIDSFVDWETGECKFNDGYFEKVLEFANTFPKEANWNEDDDSIPTKIQSGRLLLQTMSASNMQEYQMYSLMYGEPVTFIGYPSNGGTGSYLNVSSLGINSKAKAKEGAWEFLRTFLLEDYQKNNVQWNFPVLRSALDAKFEEDMKQEFYEENGEMVEQPKTTWGYDDWEASIYAATQEQVDAMKALIDSVDGVMNFNDEISNIISEEAAAFFEGQKGAKDVADIIQSRVQIYVNENK